jgi:hypothetical protein
MFNLFHTNNRAAKWDKSNSPYCPTCQNSDETWDHIVQCNNPLRSKERKKFLSTLDKSLASSETPLPKRVAIIGGIAEYIKNNLTPDLHKLFPPASPQLHEAFQDQTKIGWDQLCLGRISKKWILEISSTQIKYPKYWGTQLLVAIWTFSLSCWNHRNSVVHGTTLQDQISVKKSHRLHEALQLQEKAINMVCHADLDMVSTPATKLSRLSHQSLENWILHVRALIAVNKNEHKHNQKCMHQRGLPLRHHFLPG